MPILREPDDPKLRNLLHSIVLVGGIAGLTAFCAYLLFGGGGVLWTFIAVALLMLVAPRVAPEAIMRMYRARRVSPDSGGAIPRIVQALSRRAGLEAMPQVYIIPSRMMNAFATGHSGHASMAVTTGMLERLNTRELAAVLAHEIAHIRNGDLWTMSIADMLSRITLFMSHFAIILVAIYLPFALTGQVDIPWLVVLVLYFAPTISSLMQLALSRAREYDADHVGAQLSGDPEGLASALMKLERYQGQFWENIFMPGRNNPAPSVLRSHPKTEDRIARLRELNARDLDPLPLPSSPMEPLSAFGRLFARPRYHWMTGLWY